MTFTSAEVEAELRKALAAGDEGFATHLRGVLGQSREREAGESELAKMSGGEKFVAGMGRGMLHVGQHVPGLNRLLPKGETDSPSSKALTDTGWGGAGNLTGEAVATAPVGMAVGAVAGPAAAALTGAGKLARLGRFAAPLAAEGGAIGGLMSDADTAGGVIGDAAIGAGIGVGGGYAVKKAGDTLRRVVRFGGSKPSPYAERLMAKGVQPTAGQARPEGILNQVEESMTSFPILGPGIAKGREGAVDQFRDAALQMVPPAGFKPTAGAPVGKQIEEIADAFKGAYKGAEGHTIVAAVPSPNGPLPFQTRMNPITNQRIPGAFERAATNPDHMADPAQQQTALNYLNNQIGILKQHRKGLTSTDSAALLKVRSNVRDKIRESSAANKPEIANIFRQAADDITSALDAGLPPDVSQAVKLTDGQYAKFADVYEAAAMAFTNESNFTGKQLIRGAGIGQGKLNKAKGKLGEMGDLGVDAAQTFDMKSPPTGARLMGLLVGGTMKIPGLNSVPALVASVTSTPGAAKLLTGNTKLQRKILVGLSDAEKSEAMARIRSAAVRGFAADAVDEQ